MQIPSYVRTQLDREVEVSNIIISYSGVDKNRKGSIRHYDNDFGSISIVEKPSTMIFSNNSSIRVFYLEDKALENVDSEVKKGDFVKAAEFAEKQGKRIWNGFQTISKSAKVLSQNPGAYVSEPTFVAFDMAMIIDEKSETDLKKYDITLVMPFPTRAYDMLTTLRVINKNPGFEGMDPILGTCCC